jgi:hypothetical protein
MGFFKKMRKAVTKPKANVLLKLNKSTYVLGEDLEGVLSVTSEEEVDVSEVRAELEANEKRKKGRYETETSTLPDGSKETKQVWKEQWETATFYTAKPQISGPVHLTTGNTRDFSFSIAIPASGQPSFMDMDGSVTWSLKVVMGIGNRPDIITPTFEVQVIKAPEPPTIIKEKLIEREVVLIPCKYCGALMQQTAIFCPHCGARRTG